MPFPFFGTGRAWDARAGTAPTASLAASLLDRPGHAANDRADLVRKPCIASLDQGACAPLKCGGALVLAKRAGRTVTGIDAGGQWVSIAAA